MIKLKAGISLLLSAVLLAGAAGSSCAEELRPHSYEMHFLLDSDLALDETWN